MAEIAARIGAQSDQAGNGDKLGTMGGGAPPPPVPNILPLDPERRALQLSIDDIPHPAYMVNYNFEVPGTTISLASGCLATSRPCRQGPRPATYSSCC